MDSDTKIIEKIVMYNHDAIIFADKSGIIRLWNRGAEEMLGFTAEEAIGQSLNIFIPENLRQQHWEGYHQVMAGRESRYGRELLAAPGLKKDGSRLSLEFSMVVLRDSEGGIIGVGAIMRDVTSRFAREKELRARIKELESAKV